MVKFGAEYLCHSCGHNEFYYNRYVEPDKSASRTGEKRVSVIERYTCLKCGWVYTSAETFYED